MNIRPTFIQHNEWADSMADWAEHQHFERERLAYLSRDYGPKDRAEGAVYAVYAPQGRAEQGWRVRNSAEPMPVVVDKLPEAFDQGERSAKRPAEDQSEGADGVLLAFFFVIFVVIGCGYYIARYQGGA